MKDFTITIPCKKYIRKYFTHIYGEQINLSHECDFGDTILTKISTKPIIRLSKQFMNIAFKHYNDEIKFTLPFSFLYYTHQSLNKQNIHNINRYLQNTFEADLFTVMNIGAAFGVERKTSAEAFAKKYGLEIDKDITLDAMLQSEYRNRTQKPLKNLFLVYLSAKLHTYTRA